ncbi:MAG: hypothetical protein ACI9YL_000393 [Luteibaculaceae bacterium]
MSKIGEMLILVTIGMLALAFAGIAVKILLKKNGEFAGTCASQSPFLNKEGENCSFCGATPEEKCKKEETE